MSNYVTQLLQNMFRTKTLSLKDIQLVCISKKLIYVVHDRDIIGRFYKEFYLAHCKLETAWYGIYNPIKDLKIVERLLGLQNILHAKKLALITPFTTHHHIPKRTNSNPHILSSYFISTKYTNQTSCTTNTSTLTKHSLNPRTCPNCIYTIAHIMKMSTTTHPCT